MVRIEIITGPDAGRQVDLQPGTHVVGRQDGCDLQLPVTSVSGRHLEIRVGADGSVHFQDLGSTNGTHSGGQQVLKGEWFPGSELRLGTVSLRLLDPAAATRPAEDAEDRAAHVRARQAAMAGGRRGVPLMLITLLVLVGGAGGGYWYLNQDGIDGTDGPGSEVGESGTQVTLDWIDNLGEFSDPDVAGAWQLGEGLTIEGGVLRGAGLARRAQLARSFPLAGSMTLRAEIEGGAPVVPLIDWGAENPDQKVASWQGADLRNGPCVLSMPAEAQWFRLSLLMSPGAMVRRITVAEGNGEVTSKAIGDRRLLLSGANLLLHHRDGRALVHARGSAGSWEVVEEGLRFDPGGTTTSLTLTLGEAAAEAGPLWILSEGGPIEAAPGVVVEESPGLLMGGGARRFLMRFPKGRSVAARDRQVSFEVDQEITLRSDLNEEISRASRIARQLESAVKEKDRAQVLLLSSTLLRDLPFDEEKIVEARRAARATLDHARQRLSAMTREAEDATFLEDVQALARLEVEARALASALAGTDLSSQASNSADAWRDTADLLLDGARRRRAEYRQRLGQALSGAYPLIAAWLQQYAPIEENEG